jgi:GH35 family endo-1,4-beta-xylanase
MGSPKNNSASISDSTSQPDLEQFIKKAVNRHISQVFVQAHHYAGTTYGDITPEQQMKLEEIEAELCILIEEQVTQNL